MVKFKSLYFLKVRFLLLVIFWYIIGVGLRCEKLIVFFLWFCVVSKSEVIEFVKKYFRFFVGYVWFNGSVIAFNIYIVYSIII